MKKIKFDIKGGYLIVRLVINRVFNFLISLILLILAVPLFIIISIIIKVQDGGPVFYNAERLGLKKKLFKMYKFRTLIPNAEQIVGADIPVSKHKVITPFGKFLRDTRLDELPQLINILKGEMDLVGPRPIRYELYDKLCKQIKGFDKRFSVNPGLIGFPGLFISHSAPRKIQSMVDNKYLQLKQNFIFDACIVLYTITIVIKKVVYKGVKYIWNHFVKSIILGKYDEKRSFERFKHKGAKVHIGRKADGEVLFQEEAALVNVNEEAFLIYTKHKINNNNLLFKMEVEYETHRKKLRCKSALCSGQVYREKEINDDQFKYLYVIKYKPVSPINHYMVHQYFLFESMV